MDDADNVSGQPHDAVYKLVSETISGDPTAANNGAIGFSYDAVGNRLGMTSTLGVIPARSYAYDANDRLNGETYDSNGNTLTTGAYTYTYDFEDRLIQAASVTNVTFFYDGDGNRVRKNVGATATRYLVDELNPTGYSQAVDELVNGNVLRSYTYGLQRISQDWAPPSPTAHFYVYDGHGSVRALTDIAGVVTDVYEYDAFGNLVAGFGNTANVNLYAGEQFDVDLGLYYLRARWYRGSTGRFLTGDAFEGVQCNPISQNRYLFADQNPTNRLDPSGHFSRALTWAAVLPPTFVAAATATAVGSCLAGYFGSAVGLAAANAMGYTVSGVRVRLCLITGDIIDDSDDRRKPPKDPPGDCTGETYRRLNQAVEDNCKVKGQKTSCDGLKDCIEIGARMARSAACLAARVAREVACWRHGDLGHQGEIEGTVNKIQGCWDQWGKQKCAGKQEAPF